MGSPAYRRLSKTVSGLCMSHQPCPWLLSWEATCQPAWEVLGTPFPGRSPSAQPMVLTSPTEYWEGASTWLPTISLLGSSSTKLCKLLLKNTWCVCMCPLETPCHLVAVVRS